MKHENLLNRVRAFQSYVADQSARRTESWVQAQPMVQAIAERLAARVSDVPPLNLQLAAEMLNIRVRTRGTDLRSYHGALVPVPGGFEATIFSEAVEPGRGQEDLAMRDSSDLTLRLSRRARFTLAHEIGHALFYSQQDNHIPRRIIPAPPKRGVGHWREEGLCHAFARALLIPSTWSNAVGRTPSFRTLIEASSLFRVSGEALIHRLLYDWQSWRHVVVIHISFPVGRPRVRIFRGVDRGGEKTFTKDQIDKVVKKAASPDEAATLLITSLGLADRSVLSRTGSVWALA